jgi:hypothetical protein
MVERVVVQTQREYANMNRDYLKWFVIIGGVIFGYLVLSGNYNLPTIWGIIGFVPLAIWIIVKIMRKRKN